LIEILRRALRFLGARRDPRLELLARMPKQAVCAEIGVWKGDFSDLIRRHTAPRELHLIDPWEFQGEFPERMYGGAVAGNQADMDRICEGVRDRFHAFPEVVLHRGKSEDALREFPDGFFDWVYIDGNHYYEFVLEDLRQCLARVRPGGIIAGDDYHWGEADGFPVRRAVADFLRESGLSERLEVLDSQFLIRR
jgi:SAM-dependent methyltransferase